MTSLSFSFLVSPLLGSYFFCSLFFNAQKGKETKMKKEKGKTRNPSHGCSCGCACGISSFLRFLFPVPFFCSFIFFLLDGKGGEREREEHAKGGNTAVVIGLSLLLLLFLRVKEKEYVKERNTRKKEKSCVRRIICLAAIFFHNL